MGVPLTRTGNMGEGVCLGGKIINSCFAEFWGFWYIYTEISTSLKLREETGLAVINLGVVSK